MPCGEDYEDHINGDDLNMYPVDYDEDGQPFVISDVLNLSVDRPQKNWFEFVEPDIVDLWKIMSAYVNDRSLPMLEYAKFQDFVVFVAKHSIKIRPSLYES